MFFFDKKFDFRIDTKIYAMTEKSIDQINDDDFKFVHDFKIN